MIHREPFADSQEVFKYFREVTSAKHFLRSRGLVPPPWRLLSCAASLATIWIVHRLIPPSALGKGSGWWFICVYVAIIGIVGSPAWMSFIGLGVWLRSQWIKKRLRNEIPVRGWRWRGPEVELLMLQEFTDYLADRGLYNAEALKQLCDDVRDEIEARWRAIALSTTFITLGAALFIGYYQIIFNQLLQIANFPSKDIVQLAVLGVAGIAIMIQFYTLVSNMFLSVGRERAIYMHNLSDFRLSLLRRYETIV